MPLMSLAEYSRHRGVSKAAVTYAVRDGRISTTTNHAGKRVIDSDLADVQWNNNTAHEQRRNTTEATPGLPPPEPVYCEHGRPNRSVCPHCMGIGSASPPAPSPTGPQIGFDPRALGIPDKPKMETEQGPETNYASARAFKEQFLARQAELDYRTAAGELIEVAVIKKEWTAIATLVRTKVLGLPSKARQRIPDLTNAQYLVLEKLAREALEDLAEESA